MATLHFVVLKTRQTVKKTYAIYLAITHERVVRYIRTEYEIDGLFQFDNRKVVCRKDAKILNQRLAFVLSEYQVKLRNIPDINIYTCSQLKEKLVGNFKSNKYVTIKEYMEHRINNLKKG